MLPRDLTHDIKTRLATINGQVSGLIRLLDEEYDSKKIMNQFKAVKNGFDKAYIQLVDEVFRKALAERIVLAVDACPGNCGYEDKIEFLKNQFPTFQPDEIAGRLNEIVIIEDTLKEQNLNEEK